MEQPISREDVEQWAEEVKDLPSFFGEMARALLAQDDALRLAEEHLEEIREAWARGIISEHDGQGGTRSNRNVEVLAKVRAAMLPSSEEAS